MTAIVWDEPETARESWAWVQDGVGEPWTVGGFVPHGFERYVSIPNSRDPEDNGCSLAQPAEVARGADDQLARLLRVLDPTSDQALHCAIWHGFGGMFVEQDGRVTGAAAVVAWPPGAEVPPPAERRRLQREAQAELAASRPLRPPVTFTLPHREYHTWISSPGRLRQEAALLSGITPSIVFPADRSWLWHSEIDGRRTEIGGPASLLAPLLEPEWGGIEVTVDRSMNAIPGWLA